MNQIELRNGLKVILYQMPNTHSITIGLYIRAGVLFENPMEKGITHLLEHIHFRKLNNMSQEELYYKMESIGSTLKATTYRDFLKFSMKIRPVYLEKCLSIFNNIISANNWVESDFQNERAVVINQINENESYINFDSIVRKSVFGTSNLSFDIMGSVDSVNSINLSQLLSYKEKTFNKNNMILCITGSIKEDDVHLIKNRLDNIHIKDGEKYEVIANYPFLYHRKPNIIFERLNDDYLDVNVSFDVDFNNITKDELTILNCILGEGVGSRLQKSIREELSYTANIYSQVEQYQHFAFLHIRFSLSKRFFIPCLSKVIELLNDLKININSKDLDVSLPFYNDNFTFYQDDTEQMNFSIGYNFFVLEKENKAIQLPNNTFTVNRIKEAAKNLFKSNNANVAVLGNCNKITKKSIKEIVAKLDVNG